MRSLRLVILAGEALPESLVRRHFAAHKHAVGLVNEYGPTEATVWASYHRFSGPEQVTIGRPIPGGRLYVLDEDRHPAPPGAKESFISAGLAWPRLFRPSAGYGRGVLEDPSPAHRWSHVPDRGHSALDRGRDARVPRATR